MAYNVAQHDLTQIESILFKVFGIDHYTSIERLGGLTNHSYKVELSNGDTFVIRLPGEGTETLINRKDEKISTELACKLGIDAQLLYFGENGEKVTRYIDGAKTMSASDFADEGKLEKVAEVLRKLHTSDCDTKIPFEVFDMAADYEEIIRSNSVPLFDDYEEVRAQIMSIKQYIDLHTATSRVPCHNDPLCENWVLDSTGKLYLIDWEYAGMNDGMWDLADVSIEAGLSDAHDEVLLNYYLQGSLTPADKMRFQANKLYLDFLWSLWGKARVPFDGEPMERYAFDRYIRLKENLDIFHKTFTEI